MKGTDFLETKKKSNSSGHGSDQAWGTDFLQTVEGETCQDKRKKVTKPGALTNWRRQRERLVRTRKESDSAKGTHSL